MPSFGLRPLHGEAVNVHTAALPASSAWPASFSRRRAPAATRQANPSKGLGRSKPRAWRPPTPQGPWHPFTRHMVALSSRGTPPGAPPSLLPRVTRRSSVAFRTYFSSIRFWAPNQRAEPGCMQARLHAALPRALVCMHPRGRRHNAVPCHQNSDHCLTSTGPTSRPHNFLEALRVRLMRQHYRNLCGNEGSGRRG
jgi:hypothetical protein